MLSLSSLTSRVHMSQLHPGFYIAFWMLTSNSTILFNKYLLHPDRFQYPVLLTCWHLIFSTLVTQFLARFTSLLDGRKSVRMTGRTYMRAVVPIGICYSGSLVFSNIVYLHLSVAFIQMLKASAPCIVLFISWLWQLQHPTWKTWLNVAVITLGVAMTSAGELQFSLYGFLLQLLASVFEAIRLVMIQVLLSGDDFKMDPMVSLYYFAPICAVMNGLVALVTDVPNFQIGHLWSTGLLVLMANAVVAFLLNVASVCLIGKTSSLALTLAGILKAILLVTIAVILWSTPLTFLQFIGYSIALVGLLIYSLGWELVRDGSLHTVSWVRAKSTTVWDGKANESSTLRKIGTMAGVAVLFIFTLHVITYSGPTGITTDSTIPNP